MMSLRDIQVYTQEYWVPASLTLVISITIWTYTVRVTLEHRMKLLLSQTINRLLCLYYPIKHLETKQELPTCPYQWPNGQGDVAKFLEGLSNRQTWGSRYGSIYRIWSGTNPEIVLTQSHHVREVFRDSHKHIKAPNNNSGYFLGQILGQCLGLISNSDWEAVKSVVEGSFLHVRMQDHLQLVERRVVSHLSSQETISKIKSGWIDPVEDFKMIPFWIVAEILFGSLSPEQEQKLSHLACVRSRLFRYAISGGLLRFNFCRFLPITSVRELRIFKADWASFVNAMQDNISSNGHLAPINSMLRAIGSGSVTEESLLQTLDEMLFANLDVTMGGMSWSLVMLAANTAVQDRLHEELRRQENLDAYLLDSSSYLAAAILESARLKPLAAFSVAQSTRTDRILDGYVIPAGTSFIVDTHALNSDEQFWGPDAASYRPERFQGSITAARYNYWRFGFGPRQCLGKHIADLMIRSLIVHLLQDWKLESSSQSNDWERVNETWISHPDGKLNVKRRDIG